MNNQTIPNKQGQVVRLINPLPDENPEETYLVIEDVSSYADDETIHVVSITYLQRNASDPMAAPVLIVTKSELTVVAEDLTSYVESWNR